MKIYQKQNMFFRLSVILMIFFVFAQLSAAQQLKPTEIIYSRLPTNVNAPATGANSPTIWAVGQDGSNDRVITTGTQPRISDDGRFIIFKRITGGSSFDPFNSNINDIYVRELATGQESVFSYYSDSYYFSPFSNQGNYEIVLQYGANLYKVNRDGTGGVLLTPTQSFEGDGFPVLRRDDSLIALQVQGNNIDASRLGINTQQINGTNRQRIPNTGVGDYNPSWSNDNQFLAYGSCPASRSYCYNFFPYPYYFTQLTKIKPDGTGKSQLIDVGDSDSTIGIAYGGVWTEDNSKVIVAARINGVAGLYAVKADGSGTYTRIPLTNGSAPDFVGGIVQTRNDAQLISSGGGVMTDQNGNFTYDGNNLVNSDGTIDPVQPDVAQALQFSLVDSIGEPVAGDAMSGGGFTFQSGFIPNTPPNIAGGNGMEGDVAGRPNGDGQVLANDVVQIQRFQIGLDQPFLTNEFQRVDSAPFIGKGDGQLLANDVVETQRYQIGLDQTQNAAGPVDYGSSLQSGTNQDAVKDSGADSAASIAAATREVRIESRSASAGQTVTVNVRVDAAGDESAYGFTLNYDSAVFTNPTTSIGTAGGSRLCNTTIAGQIKCSIINFPDDLPGSSTDQIGEIAAGNNQLLMKVNFTVPANAVSGTSAMTLSGVNASNDAAQNLTISSQSGTITVMGTTAAGVSVGGRVSAGGKGLSGAVVIITDARGTIRAATTSSFGYFRFDEIRVGETYVVGVKSKLYTFAPQVVSVTSDLSNLNFTAH